MAAATMAAVRKALAVDPATRLSADRVQSIHAASLELLDDPGIWCTGERALAVFEAGGCRTARVSEGGRQDGYRVRIPAAVIERALESAPDEVVLGARDPANTLVLRGKEPKVYFGTGSQANLVLESRMASFRSEEAPEQAAMLPVYSESTGSIAHLCRSAHLAEHLSNVDFFIRNVNAQDESIPSEHRDVNIYFAALLHTTKHVQGGLESLEALQPMLRLAELVATDGAEPGGANPGGANPGHADRGATGRDGSVRGLPVSFIACPVKSPLQMVADTAEKVVAIAEADVPLVISCSPQGGSTAPIQEEGMVAQINAEILAGLTLAQLARPGCPVLYGAVPVRARLDNLHDFYGAPEFVHYNLGCVQMARSYGIPCYSSAGVGDAKRPGMQATVEKLPSHLSVAASGAQYIHYAFGLLDRTNVFSPLQAVLDDGAIGLVKQVVRPCSFSADDLTAAVEEIRSVARSSGVFARRVRKQLRRGVVGDAYAFADDGQADRVLERAQRKLEELYQLEPRRLSDATVDRVYAAVPGLIDRRMFDIR